MPTIDGNSRRPSFAYAISKAPPPAVPLVKATLSQSHNAGATNVESAGRGAVLLLALALAACQPAPVPRLTEQDLLRAAAMDTFGEVPEGDIAVFGVGTATRCDDLHRPMATFADDTIFLDDWERWKLRLGWDKRYQEWETVEKATMREGLFRHVDPSLNRALQQAATQAMLSLDKTARPPEREWPEACELKYWFHQPSYSGNFAFIDVGSTCGDLCGSGRILALEYRNRRWRVVARLPSWIA